MQITKNCIVKQKNYKLYHTVFNTKISNMENGKIGILEKVETYLKKAIQDFKITLPLIITLISFLIYFMIYFYNLIYFRYYSIDVTYYSPSIHQTVSSVIIWFLISIILMFVVFYKYTEDKSHSKKTVRIIFKNFCSYAVGLLIFTVMSGYLLFENFSINQIPLQYIINFFICFIIYRYIVNYNNKKGSLYQLKTELKNSNKVKGGILINFIVIFIAIIFTIGIMSIINNIIVKNSFKVIYNEQMSILQVSDNFEIECDVILYCNSNICITTKGKIKKKNNKYELKIIDLNQKKNVNIDNITYRKYNFYKSPSIYR